MKKIVLLLFVVCAAISVNAQVYVGGTAGFWRNNDDDSKVTAYSVLPEVGYELNDKWAVGAEFGYAHIKVGDNSKRNVFGIAPYARYTYCETGIVRLFLDGSLGVSSYKIGDADRETGFEVGLRPGIALKLTDKFSLIAKVGFVGYRDDYGFANAGFDSGFGLGLSGDDLQFGFQVKF